MSLQLEALPSQRVQSEYSYGIWADRKPLGAGPVTSSSSCFFRASHRFRCPLVWSAEFGPGYWVESLCDN